MRTVILFTAFATVPLWAQLAGFSKKELIQYTPLNPFERFADGRPKAPGALIKRLEGASSEEVWGGLTRSGYRSQFDGGWKALHTDKVLVGRVFTAQYMPVRPEFVDSIEPDKKSYGKYSQSNERVIDMLQPGDVLVVDLFGKVENGAFLGDNLARAIRIATGNGFLINGGVRDLQGLERIGVPIYSRGYSPTVYQDVMLTGINVPIRIGDVTVMPGDIVFGDREGVSFIPPHVLEKVADYAEWAQIKDEWTEMKMNTRKYKSLELYPSPPDPVLQKEFEAYLKKRQAERRSK